jgi:hypothetical protein
MSITRLRPTPTLAVIPVTDLLDRNTEYDIRLRTAICISEAQTRPRPYGFAILSLQPGSRMSLDARRYLQPMHERGYANIMDGRTSLYKHLLILARARISC